MAISRRFAFRHGGIGLIVLALSVAEARAQTASQVEVGVLGGVNLTKLTIPLDLLGLFPDELPIEGLQISNHIRTGLVGGLFITSPQVFRRVAFETGALVSVKGSHLKITIPGFGSAGGDLRVIYLDVPALARVGVARSSSSRLFLLAGPTIGAKLHAKMSFGAGGESESMELPDFPTMDVGLTAGGRFEMSELLVDVRYTHGLRNLVTGAEVVGITVKNRALSIMGGWRFK